MEEFDIREFAQMFDAALASDNPSVKKALRNFMMIAAIVHPEEGEERLMGPLETLVKKVCDLERIVHDMQKNRIYKDHKDYYKDYYGTNPTWVGGGPLYTYNPNTSVSTTSGTTWEDTSGYSVEKLSELLKDL